MKRGVLVRLKLFISPPIMICLLSAKDSDKISPTMAQLEVFFSSDYL